MKIVKFWFWFLLILALYASIFYKEIYNVDNRYLNNLHVVFFVYVMVINVLMIFAAFGIFTMVNGHVSIEPQDKPKMFKLVKSSFGLNFVLNRIFWTGIIIGLAIIDAWWFFSFLLLQEFEVWYIRTKTKALREMCGYKQTRDESEGK